MKITTNVEIDIEDFALSLEYKEAAKVIKVIDKEMQEADFTFEMAKWFITEVALFDEEGSYLTKLKAHLESLK